MRVKMHWGLVVSGRSETNHEEALLHQKNRRRMPSGGGSDLSGRISIIRCLTTQNAHISLLRPVSAGKGEKPPARTVSYDSPRYACLNEEEVCMTG
ncbi:MAG: hypothetical protein ACLR0U_33085 [Enterocloster clostridioformis]